MRNGTISSDTADISLIKEIRVTNLLSYGPDAPPIELGPLNVIIGPNGSGKSNLIEAVSLLRSAPTDITSPFRGRGGGGISEWIWKGSPEATATIDVVVRNPHGNQDLRHSISFRNNSLRFELLDERVENEHPYPGHPDPLFYYKYQGGRPIARVEAGEDRVPQSATTTTPAPILEPRRERMLQRETVDTDKSILSQRRDPEAYPVLSYMSECYSHIKMYREWIFGRKSVFREPQQADLRNDSLEEDFSNLGLFLNLLGGVPKVKRELLDALRDLYDGVSDFGISVGGGNVQVNFTEGDFSIPATRLSDGTLRYLCLLAILCDPSPPPLVCIEEPELGLHPDILPKLADIIRRAAQRTQIIVTTHSDMLVNCMTDDPESVLICEKHNSQSVIKRLKKADLEHWLDKYRLGELWLSGELGGTRW